MSMRCKHCGEPFPIGQPFDMFELRRQHVIPNSVETATSTVHYEDAGIFCARKCLTDYLKGGDKSGLFDLGMRKKLE